MTISSPGPIFAENKVYDSSRKYYQKPGGEWGIPKYID
jgi:hypothetical protein